MTVTAMPPKTEDTPSDGTEVPKRRRGRRIIAGVVVLLLVAAAAWFLVLRPHSSTPKPGTVLPLDEQTVNLAGGHYLKVQISLQLTKSAKDSLDGSRAENDVINLFSGRDVAQLDSGKVRLGLQQRLKQTLIRDYDGQVMDVYLTEFVTD